MGVGVARLAGRPAASTQVLVRPLPPRHRPTPSLTLTLLPTCNGNTDHQTLAKLNFDKCYNDKDVLH